MLSGESPPKLPCSSEKDHTVLCGPKLLTIVWSENHLMRYGVRWLSLSDFRRQLIMQRRRSLRLTKTEMFGAINTLGPHIAIHSLERSLNCGLTRSVEGYSYPEVLQSNRSSASNLMDNK